MGTSIKQQIMSALVKRLLQLNSIIEDQSGFGPFWILGFGIASFAILFGTGPIFLWGSLGLSTIVVFQGRLESQRVIPLFKSVGTISQVLGEMSHLEGSSLIYHIQQRMQILKSHGVQFEESTIKLMEEQEKEDTNDNPRASTKDCPTFHKIQ